MDTNKDQYLAQYLTYKDVAKRLSRSTNTIRRWAAINYSGFPSPSYLGRTAVFREVDVVAWVYNQLSSVSPDTTGARGARGVLSAKRASAATED